MQEDLSPIERRKSDHLAINLEQDVFSPLTTQFEQYRFLNRALPEIDLDQIDIATELLGHRLETPILISSMTGGFERAHEINLRLAKAAQAAGCAMGVGSQRAAIENRAMAHSYQVRDLAPDILLFANLGAIQLANGYGVEECRRAVEMIGADALVLHINAMQEALQPEGNHNFSFLASRIAAVCDAIDVPVIVKEVGFGISSKDVRLLANAGVAAIDVAGAGGTSWSRVERHRAQSDRYRRLGDTFADWGIPTATSLRLVREQLPNMPLIASGGLRTGLDAAKAIALGASLAGFAGPMLHAANQGEEAAVELLATLTQELRLAMFGSGTPRLDALREADLLHGEALLPPRSSWPKAPALTLSVKPTDDASDLGQRHAI